MLGAIEAGGTKFVCGIGTGPEDLQRVQISTTTLFGLIRKQLAVLLNGYIQARELMDGIDDYIVPPALGARAGVLGALVLAEGALNRQQSG